MSLISKAAIFKSAKGSFRLTYFSYYSLGVITSSTSALQLLNSSTIIIARRATGELKLDDVCLRCVCGMRFSEIEICFLFPKEAYLEKERTDPLSFHFALNYINNEYFYLHINQEHLPNSPAFN